MSDTKSDMTSDLLCLVRASSRTLPLADILRGSPQELLGVSTPALAALKTLEINTVFDLSTSQVSQQRQKLLLQPVTRRAQYINSGVLPLIS